MCYIFPKGGLGTRPDVCMTVVTSEEVRKVGKGEEERVIMRPHGKVGCTAYTAGPVCITVVTSEEERVIMRPHGKVGCSCYLLHTPPAKCKCQSQTFQNSQVR